MLTGCLLSKEQVVPLILFVLFYARRAGDVKIKTVL